MTRAQRLGHTATSTSRVVVEIVVASVVAGVVMGVAWWLLAPDVTAVVVGDGLRLDAREGQQLFGRDAVFALLGAGCGLVLAAVFSVRHRHRPVTVLVAVAVLGLGGSLLAQLSGGLLAGGDDVSGLADGTEHVMALEMQSQAGLIVWSMVATVVVAVIAVFRDDRTPWAVPGAPPS